MTSRTRRLVPLLLLILVPGAAAQSMYFSGVAAGFDPILKAGMDGSNPTWIVFGLDTPTGLAVDPVHGKLYWTHADGLQRSNLDGSQKETLATGLSWPGGVAVDGVGGHVYWSSLDGPGTTGVIERADLDGANRRVLASVVGLSADLELDLERGRLFWTEGGRIRSANLMGGDVRHVVYASSQGIALDPRSLRILWTESGAIRSADYDGSNVQTILGGLADYPLGIAFDVGAEKVYWVDSYKVQRVDLDGSNFEVLYDLGIPWPLRRIAIDGSTALGTPYCFGDGSGAPCPCGNAGAPGAGCANGSFPGARLTASGWAGVTNDTVTFRLSGLPPGELGLLFQGDHAIGGAPFGDGLRCAGDSVVRLEELVANGAGEASSSVPVVAAAGVGVGDTKRYQHWYRDPTGSPCGAQFNSSNGVELIWGN